MPNIKVKYIIDENGDRVAPITHIDAVRDSNGDGLSNLMTPEKNGSGIGTCSTSLGTALTVSLTGYELVTNGFVAVTFENDVPANATLNVNGKGAKPIIYKGSAIETDVIKAGDTALFSYNGTNYVLISSGGSGGAIQEFAVISLKTDNNTDSALTGATIVITDNNTSETILSTTWSGTDVIVGIDGGVEYMITVGNVTDYKVSNTQSYTAIAGLSRQINFVYSYEVYVDFGLPSGIKWAKNNVGASYPYQIGLYFQWGNILGYPDNSSYQFNDTEYQKTPGSSLTGNIPTNSIFDAAQAIMGSSWRIPSKTEYEELIDNTDMEYITNYLNSGVNGWKFMKKTDHNIYIFIPATGYYRNNAFLWNTKTLLWTSTNNNTQAYYFLIDGSSKNVSANGDKFVGVAIRAVK